MLHSFPGEVAFGTLRSGLHNCIQDVFGRGAGLDAGDRRANLRVKLNVSPPRRLIRTPSFRTTSSTRARRLRASEYGKTFVVSTQQFSPLSSWYKGTQQTHFRPPRLSAKNLVVLRVASDPEPENPFRNLQAKRTVMKPHSDRAVLADLLEVQGGMGRICLEQVTTRIRQLLNLPGQLAIAGPKVGRGEVLQSSFVLPAL